MCGLTSTSDVYCWGTLHGDSSDLVSRQAPARVNLGGQKADSVSVGLGHACVRVRGQVLCWGANAEGELGNGTTKDSVNVPLPVPGIATARALSVGRSHTCAVVDDPPGTGQVRCWGADDTYQLGYVDVAGVDPFETRPVPATNVSGAKEIAAGDGHTCALLGDASLVCWGLNANGALGNDSAGANVMAIPVRGLTATAVSAYAHTCVVTPEGRIRCWGLNRNGQLGDLGGPGEFVSVPYEVALR
jgi:alpha-tubulin suppressor-like RCC1 family protein